jgi:hypothetical protein
MVGAVFVAVWAMAADPPPLPANAKVPQQPFGADTPDDRFTIPIAGRAIRYSREQLLEDHASSVLLPDRLRAVQPPDANGERSVLPTLLPSYYSIMYNSTASFDAYRDAETAIKTINLPGGVSRTTTIYTKAVATNQNYFSSTTDEQTFTRGQLNLPCCGGINNGPIYSNAGDPVMGENPYTTGIGPLKMYVTAVTYNTDPSTNPPAAIAPAGIRVWQSSDGGASWSSGGSEVIGSSTYLEDKPAMTVSWAVPTLGYVYVTWTEFQSPKKILLRRSRNGVSRPNPSCSTCAPTWDPIVEIAAGNVQMSQVVVDNSGNVYVFWVDFTSRAIYMKRSLDAGATFGGAQLVASNVYDAVRALGGKDNNQPGVAGVRSQTMPWAKWNAAAGKLCVVWHQKQDSTLAYSDIFYTSKRPSDPAWPTTPVRLFGGATFDQFQPAFDPNSAGNMLVTYYSSQDDAANTKYKEYLVFIDAAGAVLTPPSDESSFTNDPVRFGGFIGDYQDVWNWTISDTFGSNNRWQASWSGVSGNQPNIYLSGIR